MPPLPATLPTVMELPFSSSVALSRMFRKGELATFPLIAAALFNSSVPLSSDSTPEIVLTALNRSTLVNPAEGAPTFSVFRYRLPLLVMGL